MDAILNRTLPHSINSSSVLTAHTKDNDGLAKALKDADIVVIPAGVPRKVRVVFLICQSLLCLTLLLSFNSLA